MYLNSLHCLGIDSNTYTHKVIKSYVGKKKLTMVFETSYVESSNIRRVRTNGFGHPINPHDHVVFDIQYPHADLCKTIFLLTLLILFIHKISKLQISEYFLSFPMFGSI